MSTRDLAHDLATEHDKLRALAELARRVRQHPRYPELCRAADDGTNPDHPGVALADFLAPPDEVTVGTYRSDLAAALVHAHAWLDAGDDLDAALREYDGDADALTADLDTILADLEGTDE